MGSHPFRDMSSLCATAETQYNHLSIVIPSLRIALACIDSNIDIALHMNSILDLCLEGKLTVHRVVFLARIFPEEFKKDW